MPNIKSAKKRVRVSAIKSENNKGARTEIKTVIKNAKNACEAQGENSEAAVKAAIKKIDQAAAKGLIHKNNAARKKSQLAKKLNTKNA